MFKRKGPMIVIGELDIGQRAHYVGISDDPMIRELVDIGCHAGYLGTPDDAVYDEHLCHLRAREIGATLDRQGGIELMRTAHEQVYHELGPVPARELEACWGGVGRWER